MSDFELIFAALIATLFAIFLVRVFFPLFGLLDNPKKFGFKRNPVPYPAGLILPLVFFPFAFYLFPDSRPMIGFFIASLILLIFSFYDDRNGLSPFIRLGVQSICAGIIIASGIGINEILHPFGGEINLNQFSIPVFGHNFYPLADLLIFFWIIGMINATNWTDGVSGNTSGLGAIAGFVIYFLASSEFVAQGDLAQLSLVFAIICTVFFFFDIQPKILMGDSGSMFIGFSIAVFSVFAGGKIATTILIMGIPIFDAFFTIYRRIKNGFSPFKGDLKHFHHILIEKGLSRKKAVFVYLTLCTLFAVPTIFLETEGKYLLLIFLLILLSYLQIKLRKN